MRFQERGRACPNGCGFVSHARNGRIRASCVQRHVRNSCPRDLARAMRQLLDIIDDVVYSAGGTLQPEGTEAVKRARALSHHRRRTHE